MVITAKGQVTIPQRIREAAGLLPNTEVEFELDGDEVGLHKVRDAEGRGRKLVAFLAGRATSGLSTEQIMAHTRGEP